jgi:hypothetical protein
VRSHSTGLHPEEVLKCSKADSSSHDKVCSHRKVVLQFTLNADVEVKRVWRTHGIAVVDRIEELAA